MVCSLRSLSFIRLQLKLGVRQHQLPVSTGGTMSLSRQLVRLTVFLSLTSACGGLADPAPNLILTLSQIQSDQAGGVVRYQFTLANRGEQSVFVPACNQQVRPDFSLDGPNNFRDGVSGSACIAILDMSPRRLAAGAVIHGEGVVARRVGVRYTPSVSYAFRSEMTPRRMVHAPSFVVP